MSTLFKMRKAAPVSIVAYLALDFSLNDSELNGVAAELGAAGVKDQGFMISGADLRAALHSANAHHNTITGQWQIPGAHPPDFAYDTLQNYLTAENADRRKNGAAEMHVYRAWQTVKGQLRKRWAQGNYKMPSRATVLKWAAANDY